MKIYAHLFAYITQAESINLSNSLGESVDLEGRNRPVLVLDSPRNFNFLPSDLPVAEIQKNVYEIGFPYLNSENFLKNHRRAHYPLQPSHGQTITLRITDEILNAQTCESESQEQELKAQFTWRIDHQTTDAINRGVGLFHRLFKGAGGRIVTQPLLAIQSVLTEMNQEDAKLPPIVALERKYQLRRKLDLIGSKMRSQLRRQAEMMPVSKIQEMDAYCLRDYIRRPGHNPAEKAGSRQALMGIQRYQDFNTPENKFLAYFAHLLHLECVIYADNPYTEEIRSLYLSLKRFEQAAITQGVQQVKSLLVRPNYVLQQNPLYRNFYQAYLELLARRTTTEKIWSFRHRLLGDLVYILSNAAILRWQNIAVSPLVQINGSDISEGGSSYIRSQTKAPIQIFVEDAVWTIYLEKSTILRGDWTLCMKKQNLSDGKTQKLTIPLWFFWYPPSAASFAQGRQYIKSSPDLMWGIIFCWQKLPEETPPNQNHLVLVSLSEWMEQGWLKTVEKLSQLFLQIARLWEKLQP